MIIALALGLLRSGHILHIDRVLLALSRLYVDKRMRRAICIGQSRHAALHILLHTLRLLSRAIVAWLSLKSLVAITSIDCLTDLLFRKARHASSRGSRASKIEHVSKVTLSRGSLPLLLHLVNHGVLKLHGTLSPVRLSDRR